MILGLPVCFVLYDAGQTGSIERSRDEVPSGLRKTCLHVLVGLSCRFSTSILYFEVAVGVGHVRIYSLRLCFL